MEDGKRPDVTPAPWIGYVYKHFAGFSRLPIFPGCCNIMEACLRNQKGKRGERKMKRVFIALLAVLLSLATASGSYAVKDNAAMSNPDEILVVNNPRGEQVGTIRGALEDPEGNIAFVIVKLSQEVNGKENIVVPVNSFSQTSHNGAFVVNMSPNDIEAAPEFNASKLDDPAYAEGLYRFYGQTPPWE